MKVVHEFRPGLTNVQAADALIVMAKATGDRQHGVFNGVPLFADWNSDRKDVLNRWYAKGQEMREGKW